jgi:hypothetical protein
VTYKEPAATPEETVREALEHWGHDYALPALEHLVAQRDAIQAALEEHIYFVGGPYYCAKHGHGPCSARQALKELEEK